MRIPGANADVLFANVLPLMWNVLFVEPWTPGHAPVASDVPAGAGVGRRLGEEAVAARLRAVLEERRHRRHEALGRVLRDDVLAHAVGDEEHRRAARGAFAWRRGGGDGRRDELQQQREDGEKDDRP